MSPPVAIAIAAPSKSSRERIELLVRSVGARLTGEGGTHDILLIAIDSSTAFYAANAAQSKPSKGLACAVWVGPSPTAGTLSRLQRAGVAAIVPITIEPSRFRAVLRAIQAGLQVIDPALLVASAPLTPAVGSPPEELTSREQQVLEMMAEGLSNKEVSSRLAISTHTVKFHISSILGKLGAASRTEAVSIGVRTGRLTI